MQKKVQTVIVDTNFWLLPFESRINILEGIEKLVEYNPIEYIALSPVVNELMAMANSPAGAKNKIAAKSALALIDRLEGENKAKKVDAKKKADDAIIEMAAKMGAWVATNDAPLRLRLKKSQIKTIILKDKHAVCFA